MAWCILVPNDFGELIPVPEDEAPPLSWVDEDGIIHKQATEPGAARQTQRAEQPVQHDRLWHHALSLLESRERVYRDHMKASRLSQLTRDDIIDAISSKAADPARERVQGGPGTYSGPADMLVCGHVDKMLQASAAADREDQKQEHDDYTDLRRLEWARYRLPLHLATVIEFQFFSTMTHVQARELLTLSRSEYEALLSQALTRLAVSLTEAL